MMTRGVLRGLLLAVATLPMMALPTMGFTLKGDFDLADKWPTVTPLKEGVYGFVSENGLLSAFKFERTGSRYAMTSPSLRRTVTFYMAPLPKGAGAWGIRYIAQMCDDELTPRCRYGLTTVTKEFVLIAAELLIRVKEKESLPKEMKDLLDGPDETGAWQPKSMEGLLEVMTMARAYSGWEVVLALSP